MDSRVKALIAIGASITANCQPCLSYHVGKAKEAGVDESEISMAIEVAKAVRKGAAAKMDDFSTRLGAAPETAACCADQGCGCSA